MSNFLKYAVVFEPFDTEGLEYVKESSDNSWTDKSPIKTFPTRELAQVEADKWNTGQVVPCETRSPFEPSSGEGIDEPDFIME